ncbi:MJ1255/VC2487 family glycosyltransferase [Teredinibacter purpureus]|uniref:MJ1255/VC2487 family glycosyltransferase n=1 Tax=Teredinibacter purpureus TaxID=2731756 RepID=UPI0005F7A14C|nr:MJ1255/VC2487 family glycosyltransferase [Teredinibacter purpureus]
MKILYGVQGTGNGHISRARAMNKYLKENEIDVDYVFSGRERNKYFDMEEFGAWRDFKGLTFVHNAGKLSVIRTLKDAKFKQLWQDINSLEVDNYDLIVTDFEPITAWAAKRAGKFCLGVGHQYAFEHKVPRRGDDFIARTIMSSFAPASEGLGLHWHHFNQAILPPIVELDPVADPVDKKKILVYLGFEDSDEVIRLLEPFEEYSFYYYGPFYEYQSLGHIKLKPLSRDGFKYDLATANGVICNAGFELSSEAIQLGKKLLVKPLMGQLEQLSNAKAMEELYLAMTMEFLDKKIVGEWLDDFPTKRVTYPNVAKAIAEWIAAESWTLEGSKNKLIETLWSHVEGHGLPSFDNSGLQPVFIE